MIRMPPAVATLRSSTGEGAGMAAAGGAGLAVAVLANALPIFLAGYLLYRVTR